QNFLVRWFDGVQNKIDIFYEKSIDFTLRRPGTIIISTVVIFALSLILLTRVPMNFQPEGDSGEFFITFELPSKSSLEGTKNETIKIFEKLKAIKQIQYMTISIGNSQSETNKSEIYVKSFDKRDETTTEIKTIVRGVLKEFAYASPSFRDSAMSNGKTFQLNVTGEDLGQLSAYADKLVEKFKVIPDLTEISSSYKPGKPELQVQLNPIQMQSLGVAPRSVGAELRTYVAGADVGKLHQNGLEYDINLRLKPEQRNLRDSYNLIRVPNTQGKMIPLSAISSVKEVVGPSQITRKNKSRYVQVSANLAPGGTLGEASKSAMKIIEKELPPPAGVTCKLTGSSESMEELASNILIAGGLSILFIFLVLSSLYDSFITPLTIMTALPPALTGAFVALWITGHNFDMMSMIGIIALLGLVTKNSILLVDFAL
ncbi:MAG: efflux RND transporter permease subunit, partial [Spirochaetota bacterium]